MKFDIITIFPEFFAGPLDHGIVRRAREAGLADVSVHDLRAFTHDRHRTVDDRPFGGGEGMVLKPDPIFEAVASLTGEAVQTGGNAGEDKQSSIVPSGTAIVLLSASGKLFRQETARRFTAFHQIILLCGRYEGVDERVADHLATHELSIGDFVLSGGELGSALILDAVTRLIPGALGNEDSTVNESFSAAEIPDSSTGRFVDRESRTTGRGILDFPHYTRPAEFRGWPVPEILLGGNHEQIRQWRLQQALEKTRRNRPELLPNAPAIEG